MSKIGGTALNMGAPFDGTAAIGPSFSDFVQSWGDATRENARRMKSIEDWIVGPGSDEVDLASALAATMAGLKSGGWVGAVGAVAPQIAKVIYSNHVPSRYAEWLANTIAPDVVDTPRPGMGLVPETRALATKQNDDLGVLRSQSSTIVAQTAEYLGPSTNDIVAAIMGSDFDFDRMDIGSEGTTLRLGLEDMSTALTHLIGSQGLGLWWNPYFVLHVASIPQLYEDMSSWDRYAGAVYPALLDFSQLVHGDTVLSFLQRTQPALSWTTAGPQGFVTANGSVWLAGDARELWYFRCTLTDRDLAQLWPVDPQTTLSLWPGLGQVTLGTPVSFTGTALVTDVMDGILLAITDVPPGQSQYEEAGTTRFKGLGWLAFHSDNGDLENHQQIEWPYAVYTPKAMGQACSVDVWTKPGSSGIVTPWVRNL